MRMHLGRRKTHFVRIVRAGCQHTTEDVAHFRLIVDESQQRFSVRSPLADAENIFRGRIQANDQKVIVQKDDAGTQCIEYVVGNATEGSVIAGTAAARATGISWI